MATATAALDPSLASLFARSSGPVVAPVRKVTNRSKEYQLRQEVQSAVAGDAAAQDASASSTNASSQENSQDEHEEIREAESRPRKKRRLSTEDDLETSYLNRLVREEEKENLQRRKDKDANENLRHETSGNEDAEDDNDSENDDTSSSASNDLQDLSDLEPEDVLPQHESLTKQSADHDKLRRTVFLGNISTEAIKSKSARKQLETHLKSVIDTPGGESIESLRFRSTAFNVTAGPKKAAYAKKDLMDDTTQSTHAYIVLSTEAAARKISKQLNGTIILDRHLHTDWLAHPTAIDHKRCVFVGNLNFVDLESTTEDKGEGAANDDDSLSKRRPKSKLPADAEEGLWRTFSKCGTIESVRVVRDKATRIGKGFAYVQFSDEVATEKALALDGKKFPPMLPRLLRVSRAKRVLKKDLKRKRDAASNTNTSNGVKRSRSDKGSKSSTASKGRRVGGTTTTERPKKKMDGVVFEGYRASADKAMKFKTKKLGKGTKKKTGGKPAGRSSRRGAAFKASGGKKKRDI